MEKKNDRILLLVRFTALALCLLFCGVIFCESGKTAAQSNAKSDKILYEIGPAVLHKDDASEIKKSSKAVESFVNLIRKSAHVILYFSLGTASYVFFLTFDPAFSRKQGGKRKRFPLALCGFLFPLLYAVSDEIHQSFVPGRSGMPQDVFIDALGALLGVLIVAGIGKAILNARARKASENAETTE